MTTATKEFVCDGEIEVCAHRVAYWYEVPAELLVDGEMPEGASERESSLAEVLEEEVESRAKTCIVEGYHSGELNCLWNGEIEIRGWWNIVRD